MMHLVSCLSLPAQILAHAQTTLVNQQRRDLDAVKAGETSFDLTLAELLHAAE